MSACYDNSWNDDGSVTSGGASGTTTVSSGNGWVTIWTSNQSDHGEMWAHSAVVDSAPVCLKRPPMLAPSNVYFIFSDPHLLMMNKIIENPRMTRAPPLAMVA